MQHMLHTPTTAATLAGRKEVAMGLWNRLTTIFKAKANKALDAAEDPRETLDYSYERQLDMLRDVKRGIVEVTAAKRRLELQANGLRADLDKLDGQARQALQAGREDLARTALERKQLAVAQLAGFEPQIAQLDNEQKRLSEAESRLSAKIEAFRTQKEVIKAQYTAAKAQVRIGEAVTGLSEEMADVGYAIQRAEDKTAQLQSRGDAISELIDQGVLTDALETGTSLDRELAKVTGDVQVEVELNRLRGELGMPSSSKRLEAGQ
jgi:phage shock protein A